MSIDAYSGISKTEITKARTTDCGIIYTLEHEGELLIPMRYLGLDKTNSNSQGWEVNNNYYFKKLKEAYPEAFDIKNSRLINKGKAPYVNAQFVKYFPKYKSFIKKGNVILHHHHVGKNGVAVALPKDLHVGKDNIHSVEDNLGITSNAKIFSQRCEKLCKKEPSNIGKTSTELKQIISQDRRPKQNAFSTPNKKQLKSIDSQNKNAFSRKTSLPVESTKNYHQTVNAIGADKNMINDQSSEKQNSMTQNISR